MAQFLLRDDLLTTWIDEEQVDLAMRHTAHMNHQFRIGGRRIATARQRAAVDRGQVAARQRRWGRRHMGGQLAPKVLPTQMFQVLAMQGRGPNS